MVTTVPSNYVTLHGVNYPIRGAVRQQPASDFQAGLRIGSPQYDDRQGAFIITIEDLSGGLGILSADERKNEHMRVRYSDGVDTRFSRALMMGGAVTSVTLSGVSMDLVPVGKLQQWKDILLIAVGNKMFKLDGNLALTNITPATFATDMGSTAMTADLLTHEFVDGFFAGNAAIIWGLKGTGTGGTTRQYYIAAAVNPVAGDWSPQGDLSPGFELNSMVSYDGKVLAIQGGFMRESNEGTTDTWGDLAVSPLDPTDVFMNVPLFTTFIGTHRAPFGQDFMPWLLLQGNGSFAGKLAPMDYWARNYKPIELNVGRVADAYMLDEGILFSNTYDVFKLIPSDPPTLRPMGLRKQQGLPPEMSGALVSGMGAVGGDPVVGLTNLKTGGAGRVWILQHNGAGWHVRAEQSIDSAIVLDIFTYEAPAGLFGFRSTPYLCWITWDGTTCKLHYIKEPLGYGSPEQDPTYVFASGTQAVETPWMFGGHEDLHGALLRIRARGNINAAAAGTVTVKYRLDEDEGSGWSTLGTFDVNTPELGWDGGNTDIPGNDIGGEEGQQFKSIRFRFEMTRQSATVAPVIRGFVILYDKKPVTRRSYQFNVDVARIIEENNNPDNAAAEPWPWFSAGNGYTEGAIDFKAVLDALVYTKDTYTLVPFTYDNEPTRLVKIIGLPSTEEEINNSKRRGIITVQVVELIGAPTFLPSVGD